MLDRRRLSRRSFGLPRPPLKLRPRVLSALLALLTIVTLSANGTVFGPWTVSSNGRPVLEKKTFRVTDTTGRFVLRVTNKDVIHAIVVLNGRIVLWPRDFRYTGTDRRGEERWEREWDRMRRERDDEDRRRKDEETRRKKEEEDRRKKSDRGNNKPGWNDDRDDREDRHDNHPRPVPLIERAVTLQSGKNEIIVAFIGDRGSSLTLEIIQKDQTTDTTPPSITASAVPDPNGNGWNNSPVTVTFACSDADSGIAVCPAPVTISTEGAKQVVTGTASDQAGNNASVSVTLNIDRTLPLVTGTPSPAANANRWNSGPVTVTFAAVDAISGVEPGSVTAPVTLSTDGVNLSATGQATDLAGNIGSATIDGINIDQVDPVVTVSLPPAPEGSNWYDGPVTAHFSCSDAGSGIASCPADLGFPMEGPNQTASGTATDLAGNNATATSPPFGIDLTNPAITVSLSKPNANGWNNEPVTAHFTCTDAGSGVAFCPPDQIVETDGTGLTVTGTTTDRAGHSATVVSEAFNIDQIKPTISVELTAPANGWSRTPVTAHFTCDDVGAGVDVCPADQEVTTEGANQTVSGTVQDKAGNSASVTSPPFSIDLTDPTITVKLSAVPNENGWHKTVVTAHFMCSDKGSGIATCSGDQSVTTEGPNQTVTGTATDNVGRTASVQSDPISIDLTAPVVAITAPAEGAVLDAPVATVTGTVTDAVSGVASVTCNGSPVAPSQSTLSCDVALVPEDNTITVSVTDAAGHTTEVVRSVTYNAGPKITDFSPKSATVGTLITVTGKNLAPNPRITLNRLSGGTLDAPVASATATSTAFVVPAGAATGAITVVVASRSTGSASPLTITASSDFSLDVQPTSASLVAGQSVSFAVSLTSSNAFAQLATLEVVGIPGGATATFAPQRITAGQTSVLTFTAPSGQPTGHAELTITASATVDGVSQSKSASAQLNVATATTSLLGRTVVSDTLQTPLAGVTVTMLGKNGNGGTTSCSRSTVSDAAGNFLLSGLGAGCVGPQLVGYDGTTATSPEGEYAGVNLIYTLTVDQATASPVLVHLPRIDDKETFPVRQNASVDQTFNYKTIPGLSVTVYAGTTFTLEDGTTPDPFPLVAVQVPVDRLPDAKPPVPTMLSAFIVAFQPANAVASKPAAVFYPNTLNTDPGVNMTLMTLDPTLGRMVPYGTATVSTNGKQIVPDLNPSIPGTRYGIVNFDWHGPMPPPPPEPPNRPPVNPPSDFCPIEFADPCDITSGLQIVRATDIAIRGPRGSISIDRVYRSLSSNPGPFGIGSSHNYNYFLGQNAPQNALLVHLILPEGNWIPFSRTSIAEPLSNYTSPTFQGTTLSTFPDGHSELRWKDGLVYRFASSTALIVPALESITDANGNQVALTRNTARPIQIIQVKDPVGRSLTLSYDGADRITTITDPIGRKVQYTYNAQGTLETVTDPEGGITRYEYDAQNRLIRQTDARGVVVAINTYESHGRVETQIQADKGIYRFEYTFVNPTIASSPILSTTVTDPKGRVATYRFTPDGLVTDARDRVGQMRMLLRDPQKANQAVGFRGTVPCESCAAAGFVSADDEDYTLDERGNVIASTDALGRKTIRLHEPTFNKVTSAQDVLGNVTTYSYDSRGNLVTQKTSNGDTTSYTYDSFGQLTDSVDALGQRTRFSYDSFGNVIAQTTATGDVTQFRYDGVSRLVEVVDSAGRRTRTEYDRLDRIVSETDSNNQLTRFSYDGVGNLTVLTDARGRITTFKYDSMNRQISRTDAVGKTETRTYDLAGNVVSVKDRRGLTSTFVYNELNRLIEQHYADGSVVKRSYDADRRLAHVEDSASGAFTFEYDSMGLLLRSNGPTSSVTYNRDGVGRVTQRRVTGQPAANFAYDHNGNVIAASLAEASLAYTYDANNRLVNVTRPNGVRTDYSHDAVGQVSSIAHSSATSTLLTLKYSYNAGGRRASQETSSANASVTSPAAATYDDANRLIRRGTTFFDYDDNGNLTSETGSSSSVNYEWDSRNRLTRRMDSNGVTADFKYDFMGNLIGLVKSGPVTNARLSYAVDESKNVILQDSTDGGRSSILTAPGAASGSVIVRPNGELEYALTDAIQSTVLTVNLGGAVKERLSYEPFGDTTADFAYPFQFAGGLAVGGNLYRFGARFYNAELGKFISEDPLGSSVDINTYRYVGNNPISGTDPSGLAGQSLQDTGGVRCSYTIETRILICTANVGGDLFATNASFSGSGWCKDNPSCQSQGGVPPGEKRPRDSGPIPVGTYRMGPVQNGAGGNIVDGIRLTPFMWGGNFRSGLFIHSARFGSTWGCIGIPVASYPSLLDFFRRHGGRGILTVVSDWDGGIGV